MNQLPNLFRDQMKALLGDEYEDFLNSYQEPSKQGFRINPLKTDVKSFMSINPFSLEPVPWCPTGFYYSDQDRPGKHPYHSAGLYYIQEPSAMSVAETLEPKPGETILDLCAAPGGKSTQIAGFLQGQGLLIANEIHPVRVKALSENIERSGVRNALVTNESPERLAERFPSFFDRILVDAPCSGEGMFRKLEEACEDWSTGKVEQCSKLQQMILDSAATMLKPGGVLVYSTCTFNPKENEQSIQHFLTNHPEFQLTPIRQSVGIKEGRPEWGGNQTDLERTIRLWPHQVKGEGHFVAKMKKSEGALPKSPKPFRSKIDRGSIQLFKDFANETLKEDLDDECFFLFGEQLYQAPSNTPQLDKLKVVRPGWHLGTVKKGRVEPSHSMALGLLASQVQQSLSFPADAPQISHYLAGETLQVDATLKGWVLVCVDGYSLGWGKVSHGQLKNHYPKGLRRI
jgi:NOL1/NOP2/sun family putative RNA methylase